MERAGAKKTEDNKTMQECPSSSNNQEARGEKKEREFNSNSTSKYKINICCFILASNYKLTFKVFAHRVRNSSLKLKYIYI